VVKTSWANKFNNLVELPEDEIKHWLATFVNENEEHLSSVNKIHVEFKEIEDEIFSLMFKQDIIIPPMKEYIDE